ncbi:MAG: sulfite exporter TauE/SafE family protein [Homoserinimonas sp.]|jgi:uncharacterized membrane protein YfcA|nr:sulfite exporter TauE/SafE family protein [Homoserinimonas sp.]
MIKLALIGVLGGFFSGLFGVGGGIILVPLLILVLGYQQRLASGTSLAAILPTAIAGTIGYAVQGSIDWVAGGCLAVGAVAGSLLGTWLLHRLPQGVLRWLFVAFLAVVAVRMFFLIPDRSADLDITLAVGAALIVVGVITGILSGLLGVGGGVIVVPVLMLLFGVSDLVAKGTSLLMMIPTAITGTLANVRRGNADLGASAIIGILAIPSSVGGVALAGVMSPQLGSILFALLLVYSAIQLSYNALRKPRR